MIDQIKAFKFVIKNLILHIKSFINQPYEEQMEYFFLSIIRIFHQNIIGVNRF